MRRPIRTARVIYHLGEQLLRSDKDRREQRIVAERIVRTLRPHAVWVEQAPEIVKVANIQHLATPVVAQLTEPRSAVELAGLLHPTPPPSWPRPRSSWAPSCRCLPSEQYAGVPNK